MYDKGQSTAGNTWVGINGTLKLKGTLADEPLIIPRSCVDILLQYMGTLVIWQQLYDICGIIVKNFLYLLGASIVLNKCVF